MKLSLLLLTSLTALAVAAADTNGAPAAVRSAASDAALLSQLMSYGALLGAAKHDPVQQGPSALTDALYKAICHDLEDIQGVEVSRLDNAARVTGEIGIVDDWTLYRRIVARYGSLICDYVTFRPGPRLFEALSKSFTDKGYTIADRASHEKLGTMALEYRMNVLTITGYFLSDADVKLVTDIVTHTDWLTLDRDAANGLVLCDLRLEVVGKRIDVGVAFVEISKDAAEKFGNLDTSGAILNYNLVASLKAAAQKDFVSGARSRSNVGNASAYTETVFDGSFTMNGTDSGLISRMSGHATFCSSDKVKRAHFQNGGKMIIKVAGTLTSTVQEVEYGFLVDGICTFTHGDELMMDLNLENSGKPEIADNSDDYNQKKTVMNTRVTCRLGQTVVLAGSHEMMNTDNENGYLWIRRIPVLNWFFAGDAEQREDSKYLILISPSLLEDDMSIAAKPSSETKPIENRAYKTLKRTAEQGTQQVKPQEDR